VSGTGSLFVSVVGEVVFFRPGGKIARVGCHRRNREVPSTLVKIVLDTLGVTLSEWVRALG